MSEVRMIALKMFYPTMVKWWEQHNWEVIKESSLPSLVFVSNNGTDDTYCCTLYETDSNFGFVAWQISNKEVKKDPDDLVLIFNKIEEYAQKIGIEILFTTSGSQTVENALVDSGYKLGDTHVNQYYKWVQQ